MASAVDCTKRQAYVCSICRATFTRVDHLRRHTNSHTGDMSYICMFCRHCFRRPDTLKRHYRICDKRIAQGAMIPNSTYYPRGRMRTSCDRCVRLKKACNSERPCETCASKGEVCSYTKAQGLHSFITEANNKPWSLAIEESHNFNGYTPMLKAYDLGEPEVENILGNTGSASGLTDGEHGENTVWWDEGSGVPMLSMDGSAFWEEDAMLFGRDDVTKTLEQTSTGLSQPFKYLLSLTRGKGLAICFDCAHYNAGRAVLDETWNSIAFDLLRSPDGFEGLETASVSLNEQNSLLNPQFSSVSAWSGWLSRPIAIKTIDIVDGITKVLCNKRPASIVALNWSPLLHEMCIKVFSPPRIQSHLEIFWSLWYPNCPIAHKPTFSILGAKPGLVAAMHLIGSCLSSDEEACESSKMWLDCVEEMVFEDGDLYAEFRPDLGSGNSFGVLKRQLETLQAAYFICVLQNWEGSKESARRIRTHRYNTVVQAAKELIRWITAPNVAWDGLSRFDWEEFAIREQAIRTIIYVFSLDNAFAMFDNCTVRLPVQDLKVSLPCSESVFQAETSEECLAGLLTIDAGSRVGDLSVSGAIETLCQPNEDCSEFLERMTKLSVLSMFTLLTGLQSLLLQSRGLIAFGMQLSPIYCGHLLWKRAWAYVSNGPEFQVHFDINAPSWKRLGFIRHSLESWKLSKMILDSTDPTLQPLSQRLDPGISAGDIIAHPFF